MARPLLVLDMDETLIHASADRMDHPTFEFSVDFASQTYRIYGRTRPYLNDFLETMTQLYDIIIFTSSQQIYADKVLDAIDPLGRWFKKRYYRQHCMTHQDVYIKNLEIFGHDLAHTVMIDDGPHMDPTQRDNLIQITEWTEDPNDTKLKDLIPLLTRLASANDVRHLIQPRSPHITRSLSHIMNLIRTFMSETGSNRVAGSDPHL